MKGEGEEERKVKSVEGRNVGKEWGWGWALKNGKPIIDRVHAERILRQRGWVVSLV